MTSTSLTTVGGDDRRTAGTWRGELVDLVRAASGGLLFGVPLLYTMEVWWTGAQSRPHEMLLLLIFLMLPVLLLNRTGGFRASRDIRLGDAVADTIEAVALGVVVTTVVLVVLREVTLETPLAAGLGKVVYECVPFCLGIGVARHFLSGNRTEDDDVSESDDDAARHPSSPTTVPQMAPARRPPTTPTTPIESGGPSPIWERPPSGRCLSPSASHPPTRSR